MDDRSNEYQAAPPATAEPLNPDQSSVVPNVATNAPTPIPGYPGGGPNQSSPFGYPVNPSAPSQPLYPGYAPYQGPPTYPGYSTPPSAPLPGYPVYPGGDTPTGQTQYPPTIPSMNSMPLGAMSNYPSYPGYPGYPQPILTPAPPPRDNALTRPFSIGVTTAVGLGALALVGVVYALAVMVAHNDWAGGAQIAGIVAIALAVIVGAGLLTRIVAGRRASSTIGLGALLAVALVVTGASGITFASPLHRAQASSQEGSGQWLAAIGEYGKAGEVAPGAPDIARVYDEWGEQLLKNQSYKEALAQFSIVSTQYQQSGSAVDRANADTFQTYSAWVKANRSDTPYADALTFFQSYGSSSSCGSGCQSNVQAVEAQAHYQYGQQYLSQQDYADAITQFETVTSQFKQSGYAAQAHTAAAQALLGYGQQLKSSSCSNALPIYQKLASEYSDTQQGQQAKTALAAPVSVSGQFFESAASGSIQTAILAKTVNQSTGFESNDYQTSVDGAGKFTFASVAQGTYNVLYMSGGSLYIVTHASDGSFYTVSVGQLCSPDAVTIRFG